MDRLQILMEPEQVIAMAENKRQPIIEAVKNYGNRLFGFIRGKVSTDEDAEDILQDVWFILKTSSLLMKPTRPLRK